MRSRNLQFQSAAVRVITKIGPKAAGAVESLMEVASHADPKLRTDIQLALAAIGPAAAPATEMLTRAIASNDAGERESALYALRKIGPGAIAAVKPLLARVKADDSFDANAAAWALSRIAPDDSQVVAAVIPKLSKGLLAPDEQVRLECIAALTDLGAAAHSASAELERIAKEDSSPMVRAAAEAAVHPKSGE